MIKAGALFYSLVISVIIAMMTSSVILLSYFFRTEFDSLALEKQLMSNAESGMQLLLARGEFVESDEPAMRDLFSDDCDSVALKLQNWGMYAIAGSRAFNGKRERIILALVGNTCDSSKTCLYLCDQDKPIAICGNTLLKGTAFLPKAGIKRAYIEGQSYTGSEMVQGAIRPSQRELPPLKWPGIERIKKLLTDGNYSDNDSLVSIDSPLFLDSLSNSFFRKTVLLSAKGDLTISGGEYEGNIIISCPGILTIDQSVKMNNIILAAKKIRFKKGCKLISQAFATDSITVEEDVTLNYPSALGIVNQNGKAGIVLTKNDTIEGSIILKTPGTMQDVSSIILRKESYTRGFVYTSGAVDIQGIIHGSVLCRSILLKTSSSVYENHLLNAVIDASVLPGCFVSPLSDPNLKKEIVCYLN